MNTTVIEDLLGRLRRAADACAEIGSGLDAMLDGKPLGDSCGQRIRLWFEIVGQEAFAASDVREQWPIQAKEAGDSDDFVARLRACIAGPRDAKQPGNALLELARQDLLDATRAARQSEPVERQLDDWIVKLAHESARATAIQHELIEHAAQRIETLSRKMLRQSSLIVRGNVQTGDVLVGAAMRLVNALREVSPLDPRAFFGLISLQIRRELTDLARRLKGDVQPDTELSEPASGSADSPRNLECWTRFHRTVGKLPPEQKEVACLYWYQGLTLEEIAEVMRVDKSTVKRRWRAARTWLAAELHDCAAIMLAE